MTDEQAFERDHDGVVLRAVLPGLRKQIEAAEGSTTADKLANFIGFAIASVDLGPERSRAACDAALREQPRIAELLRRADAVQRH